MYRMNLSGFSSRARTGWAAAQCGQPVDAWQQPEVQAAGAGGIVGIAPEALGVQASGVQQLPAEQLEQLEHDRQRAWADRSTRKSMAKTAKQTTKKRIT